MPSQNSTLLSRSAGFLPISIWIALIAIFGATGIILRQVAIPTFSLYVTLTPGFIIPLLAGIILGPIGGALCGAIVGISGALYEPILIPLIGNIALGLSTGIPTYFREWLNQYLWTILCVVSAISIGGFFPTFIVEVYIFAIPIPIAAITASIDAAQAGVWVSLALLIVHNIVNPLLSRYQKTN